MLAVVKTPHTDIRIRGVIPVVILSALKKEYGKKLHLEQDDEEMVPVMETKGYKAFKKRVKPGDYMRIYRENLGMTQEGLGRRLGVSRAYVCDMEKGRRAISKIMAKRLSKLFDISVDRFI